MSRRATGPRGKPKQRVLLSWSSGKDSAWTLHALRQRKDVELVGLLCTLNSAAERVAMHGVRRSLLEAQAAAAKLPLWAIDLPSPCSNDAYERIMTGVLERARAERVAAIAYGDLFLEDIRAYRLARHAGTGIEPIFPLWGRATDELAREMIRGGLRARLSCVDTRVLGAEFSGRAFDKALLDALPAGIDPCGERGEFHTFVHAGPMFEQPIAVRIGERVVRDGFAFTDLLLCADHVG
ncbi:MAG: adenine nucleotide alpha hydrolase [Planctomycetota bacterium]|nr:MAG: adenine nucleotide alpha hydrolase [Planctomycetota bacterium]